MTREELYNHVKNIYIKKSDMREDVNFFIAHVFKHDLKKECLDYEKITGKDLLNEMVNKRLSDVNEIIGVWEKLKSEYKNDIAENAASKRENSTQSAPVPYKEYDMTDTHGNRLYSKGATIYLKLAHETRKLGVIDPKQKVFAIKRERAKHLFRKNNSYGFNHHFFSIPTIAFDKILLEDDYGKFLIPVKYLNENAKFLHFLKSGGFERQVFLPLEIVETFKQDDAPSVEGAEDEEVKR